MDTAKEYANSASETVSSGVNSATESLQGTKDQVSKEGNKQVAKDDNASVGDRASAAKNAASDKAGEVKHSS